MVRTWSINYELMSFLIENNIPIFADKNNYYINYIKYYYY